MPEEFPDLLHDFAREVLRDQPDNIYEYGAQYFKAMYSVSIKVPFRLQFKVFELVFIVTVTNFYSFLQRVPFDYKNKGKNIPPP